MKTLTSGSMLLFRTIHHRALAFGANTNRLIRDAQLSESTGNFEKAEVLYWTVLHQDPKQPLAYKGIFNLWARKGTALGLHNCDKMNTLRRMYQQNILNVPADSFRQKFGKPSM